MSDSMSPEWVDYNSAITLAAVPAAENFRIDANVGLKPAETSFDQERVRQEIEKLLTKPSFKRSFIIGPFTGKIDPVLGRMRDADIKFIQSIHEFYEGIGVEPYSSFVREDFGRVRITDSDATLLDQLAIDTSHVLTVMPEASESPGTWREILYGGAAARVFLFLFRKENPELEFQQTLRTLIANLSAHPSLVFITYSSSSDLHAQMKDVWSYVPRTEDSDADAEWNRTVSDLKSGLLRDYFPTPLKEKSLSPTR